MPTTECRSSALHLLASLADTPSDRVSAAVAASSIPLAFMRQEFKDMSDIAAMLAPILGCVWLGTQIVFKIVEGPRPRARDEGEDAP